MAPSLNSPPNDIKSFQRPLFSERMIQVARTGIVPLLSLLDCILIVSKILIVIQPVKIKHQFTHGS